MACCCEYGDENLSYIKFGCVVKHRKARLHCVIGLRLPMHVVRYKLSFIEL